ncbi:hypothetical protein PN836_010015 [Ningiella sp. W23]|uniref:hypothetical protein n=1 Tax=Ningiella sp. W23 TaxID=3023715 RepID=UPI0037582D68
MSVLVTLSQPESDLNIQRYEKSNAITDAPNTRSSIPEKIKTVDKVSPYAREQKPLLANKPDTTHLEALDSISINNIDDLRAYLSRADTSERDLESAIDFINSSQKGFELVAQLYLSTDEAIQKQQLFEMIYNTTNEAKVDFMAKLIRSDKLSLRRDAHTLLDSAIADTLKQEQLTHILIEATLIEKDPQALSTLVNVIELKHDQVQSNYARDLLIERLEELSFHELESVSAEAIIKLAAISPTDKTLDIMNSHLEFGTHQLQYEAIKGLRYFDKPTDKLMANIKMIMESDNHPQQIKAAAAQALVRFENNMKRNTVQ